MEDQLTQSGLKSQTPSPQEGVASFRIMMPGPGYFGGLLKRYFFASILTMIPIIVLGFAGARLYKNEYQSLTRSIYDNRIAMYEPATINLREYPAFSQIGADVAAYLADDDFFVELSERMDIFTREEQKSSIDPLGWLVNGIKVHLLGEPAPSLQERQKRQKLAVARKLQNDVDGQFSPTLLSLTIAARADTPEKAQKLAGAVMDLMIENLYRKELDRIKRTIADLESYFKTEARNLTKGDDSMAVVPSARGIATAASIELSEAEKNSLIGQAQRLGKKVQEAKDAYQQIYKTKIEQKLALEAEINRLQTHMKPTHPMVISRLEELKHVLESREIAKAKQDVDELSGQLRRIQLKLQSAGIFVGDNGVMDTASGHDGNTFYATLGTRIQALNAERISLQNQLDNPAVRNRYRLVEEASLPTKASNENKKWLVILAVPGLAIAITLLMILLCELFSAYPRDTWKIVNALKLPLLGEIKLASVRSLPQLDLEAIIEMKQALGTKGRKNLKLGRVFLAYRELITKMKQSITGRVVMLQPLDTMDFSLPFIQNLMNVFAADFSQKVLFIDFNRKEPGVAATTKGRDIYSLIEHKIRLEDLIVHRDDEALFDRIAARDDLPPTAIRAEFLDRLFDLLLKKYNYIFLYGLDTQHFLENNLIAQTVTDCFALVRAGELTYRAISLADKNVEKGKFHGLFVIH